MLPDFFLQRLNEAIPYFGPVMSVNERVPLRGVMPCREKFSFSSGVCDLQAAWPLLNIVIDEPKSMRHV